jgi:hypothetical protein
MALPWHSRIEAERALGIALDALSAAEVPVKLWTVWATHKVTLARHCVFPKGIPEENAQRMARNFNALGGASTFEAKELAGDEHVIARTGPGSDPAGRDHDAGRGAPGGG